MQSNGRRLAWIALFLLLLVVVGAVGYRLGIAHGGVVNAAAVRGFGFRYPGIGLLGLLGPLVLIGLAVMFVVLLVREPARPPAPPAPPDGGDGVDRLRELATMHAQGQLTDEEFAAAKRKLLGL
jgi:uncharacterized membrane protein